jgi:hypothetical protein
MKQEKTLFAGPWIGEFAWEIFCWHGFLRKLAKRYDRVIVACRTGHDLLYRDFADDIINYDPEHNETDMWKNRREPNQHNFHRYYTDGLQRVTVVHHDTYRARWWVDEAWNARQNFVSFGEADGTPRFDVLMIVRNTAKCNTTFRNWPKEHATQFANRMRSMGYRVGCVGTSDAALHIHGTTDYRDLPLDKLAQIMANSRVIVGPQSGPIHFGSLCLLPQVCWQTKPEHATRTQEHWNPFKVPVLTIPSDISYWKKRKLWLPSVEVIVQTTLRMLHRKEQR